MWRRRAWRWATRLANWSSDGFDVELPPEGGYNAYLRFDDHVLETRRDDVFMPWCGVEVPPGETLSAHVGVNTALVIRYRRAGVFGFLERRRLAIHGYA